MDNFESKQPIENSIKKSLEKEYIDYAILTIYLNKWIKNKIIESNEKVINLINLIEKNKKELNQKTKSEELKTKNENFLKENDFVEKKLFIFLNNNNITLNDEISKILETANKKIVEIKEIVSKFES